MLPKWPTIDSFIESYLIESTYYYLDELLLINSSGEIRGEIDNYPSLKSFFLRSDYSKIISIFLFWPRSSSLFFINFAFSSFFIKSLFDIVYWRMYFEFSFFSINWFLISWISYASFEWDRELMKLFGENASWDKNALTDILPDGCSLKSY